MSSKYKRWALEPLGKITSGSHTVFEVDVRERLL